MFYKREEYFRHTFGEPLASKFRILLTNGTEKESSFGDCSLIDVSPGGAKLFARFDIPLERNPVQIQLSFILFEMEINVQGTIVWKRLHRGGYLYGFDFEENDEIANLIVHELKLRRRLEIEEKKK